MYIFIRQSMDIFEIEYDTIDEKRLVNVPIQLVNVPPPQGAINYASENGHIPY